MRYILWVILTFSSSMLVYYQFSDSSIDFFSLVMRLITGQVLILCKTRAIEVIHGPMWAIRIAVFNPLVSFCVRLV